NSEGEETPAGIYTKAPADLDALPHVYAGRLGSSVWSGWTPTDVGSYRLEEVPADPEMVDGEPTAP
ncbi:MAG: hypothetical protein QF464_12215, partial [Myxococcota bacterium]|nr:hypothetical protein [Myxococcota bacterium]